MKKLLTIALALALALALFVPALAANETEAQINLSYTYSVPEPTYTVTIHGNMDLSLDYENFLEISVTDVMNLGGKSIEISLVDASTQYDGVSYLLALYNDHVTRPYEPYLRYELKTDLSDYDSLPKPGQYNVLGIYSDEMVDFYTIRISNSINEIMPNSEYSGYIVFGIRLVTP